MFISSDEAFTPCLIREKMGGKERRGRKVRSVFCLVGEKLRKGKENGGNGFFVGLTILFPPELERNEKDERIVHGAHKKILVAIYSLLQTKNNTFLYFSLSFSLSFLSLPLRSTNNVVIIKVFLVQNIHHYFLLFIRINYTC